MYSAAARLKMLQLLQQLLTGTKHYQNDNIRCLPDWKDNCDSGGMPLMAIEAQVASPHGYRQTPI
jgi:hypothetical protein